MREDAVRNTKEFLKQKFREYYSSEKIPPPRQLINREWGFMYFDREGMRRHISFSTTSALREYLRKSSPKHVYHSSAYYQNPSSPSMDAKGWLGADLIFDLDADHFEDAKEMEYHEQLNYVKNEVIKLIEEFIINDFCIDEKNIYIHFSGARGYHIHITDRNYIKLGSEERREIVDYIEGRGIHEVSNFSELFVEEVVGYVDVEDKKRKDEKYGGAKSVKRKKIYSKNAPGWLGKIVKALEIIDEKYGSMNDKERIEEFKRIPRVGNVKARRLNELLFSDIGGKRRIDIIKDGWIERLPDVEEKILIDILRRVVGIVGGETDEPVTCDVRRLIRHKNSLHGGTGLAVVPVKLDSMKDFDPLKDAVVFDSSSVKIIKNKDMKVKIKGEYFELKDGENELPLYAAIFFMGRGAAFISESHYSL